MKHLKLEGEPWAATGRGVCVCVCVCPGTFFFWQCHTACGILVCRPGIKPEHPAVEVWSPNHWTARDFPVSWDFNGEDHLVRHLW